MARVCAAGHGGQILLTAETRLELADEAVDMTSLGSYRLQGLPGTAELFQVGAEGMESEFPPLRISDQT
jgi:class 3 adenylate cyclase